MPQFETKFQVSEDGDLVYNLKTGRGFTRGVPNMINDVMIRVTQQQGGEVHPPALLKEIAEEIAAFLNQRYNIEEGYADEIHAASFSKSVNIF